ncbi:neuroendocrine convertase 1-like isoform X2 [Octopus vulgaris]|uniref:Neuroendocrine convertase 1-like isoform X2 n=1 Tax=Octopus vulgaris TaxID=6645 RepID=A0AA36BG53_OCTVU|nr:neuroendocrine convertase 1-like isoform X2 [Octopus vulgaris]
MSLDFAAYWLLAARIFVLLALLYATSTATKTTATTKVINATTNATFTYKTATTSSTPKSTVSVTSVPTSLKSTAFSASSSDDRFFSSTGVTTNKTKSTTKTTASTLTTTSKRRKRSRREKRSSGFTNEWAAQIPGGLKIARRVARSHGYAIKHEISPLPDHYVLTRLRSPSRFRRSTEHITKRLSNDDRILWFEQQQIRKRAKRSSEVLQLYRKDAFSDTLWSEEWYLRNPRSLKDADLLVLPCWAQNITGNGIVVTVLDDGIEWMHDDLRKNYDPKASVDLNDNDEDPRPRYDPSNENKHGTRCAGEIAMTANNNICGVGIAFNSKIGGVRMLDGPITDSLEARALGFNHKYIDIYSASWGPLDNGMTLDGPGTLSRKAMELSIKEGRDGKGVLYVWASGNGGNRDNCNCDGYASSIYTISISSITSTMMKPWYVEYCASTMASTFSGGLTLSEGKVVTADLHNECTDQHSGTSASAPMAAGIFALLLESNSNLTWRDVQHLITWTSNPLGMNQNPGWIQNAGGFWVNPSFGFGLLNAMELINAARPTKWKTVPKQHICKTPTTESNKKLEDGGEVNILVSSDRCENSSNEVMYLEHIQVVMNIDHTHRGDLEIWVISPSGTRTNLLQKRPKDSSSEGFKNWSFMSVQTWGEDPLGTWKLIVKDTELFPNSSGIVKNVTFVFYGTSEAPDHVIRAGGQRLYPTDMIPIRPTSSDEFLKLSTAELNSILNTPTRISGTEYAPTYSAKVRTKLESARYKYLLRQLKEKEAEQERKWQRQRDRQLRKWKNQYDRYSYY